ncbi:JmjC domain protein [Aulographum hederae CBS 113979]|uniref:JmjC domain protein n=1 Tax=Aulographum hederae CBS 113979 TaxID=1176131 RepID=A0A6G1GVG0_9PEZI|nr:JmjC domain protein [Aulographum hederae CBS 113979]
MRLGTNCVFLAVRASVRRPQCHRFKSSFSQIPILEQLSIPDFQKSYFNAGLPVLLPRSYFNDRLPAIQTWFTKPSEEGQIQRLKTDYLSQYGDMFVPMEITTPTATEPDPIGKNPPVTRDVKFERLNVPFELFLVWALSASPKDPNAASVYIAQHSIEALPPALRDELPTPEVVGKAGRGDIYDSSIWMGVGETYTPLHRDPNPNLFVQLAGRKKIRLVREEDGARLYEAARSSGSATMRGEEMMAGRERQVLEEIVWGDGGEVGDFEGVEAELGPGDGLFIPKAWWHSVKGVGEGVTASVNWWFR